MKINNVFVGDFETDNSLRAIVEQETFVWLWDLCSLKDFKHVHGSNINSFFEYLESLKFKHSIIYFHNLKFDGTFIIDALIRRKHLTYNQDYSNLQNGEFNVLISEQKVYYAIYYKIKNKIIEFRDSNKKIPGTVREIAVAYKLPILKGEIDYREEHEEDEKITEEEIKYIEHDTEIIARVLVELYKKDMNRLTSSSDTFNLYKRSLGRSLNFRAVFPKLSIEDDTYIRQSYRGGVCQVNPKYQDKIIKYENCYDVNSMYPFQMCSQLLPFGEPVKFERKYKYNKRYPLYIQHLRACIKIKKNHFATILDNNDWLMVNNNYIRDTGDEMIELYLTSVDLELMFQNYDVIDIEYIDGMMFKGSYKLFESYLRPLYEAKCNSTGSEKMLYKLLINSLYGKFAMRPVHHKVRPRLNYGILEFEDNDEIDESEPIYTAVSSFITAYARAYLFDAINENSNIFIYCDTDSIHLAGEGKGFKIDNKELGAFKLESKAEDILESKYLAPKTYYQKFKDHNNIKIAGCPSYLKDKIDFKDFEIGLKLDGKLIPKIVKGGAVLVEYTFEIKNRM